MGFMICETHGRVGFVETCSHVASEIDGKKVPTGHRMTIMGHIMVCDACFRSLGFDRFASLAELPVDELVRVDDGRFEAFELAYEAIEDRRGFGLECLDALELQSRAKSLPIDESDDQKR